MFINSNLPIKNRLYNHCFGNINDCGVKLVLIVLILITMSGCGNQLLNAVRQNDQVRIKSLLDKGNDINSKGPYGITPLYQASFQGNIELVNLLIANGADVNVKTKNGFTPLYVAAEKGHTQVVKRLLEANANINAQTQNGSTALLRTTETDNMGMVKILINSGADINIKTYSDYSVLHAAAFSGNVDLVNLYLNMGLGLNDKDTNDRAPIHLAAFNHKKEVFNYLLDKGAKISPNSNYHITAMMNKLAGEYYENQHDYQLASKCFSIGHEYFDKLANKYSKKAKAEAMKAANPSEPGLGAQLMAYNSNYVKGSSKFNMLAEAYEYPFGRHNAVKAWAQSAEKNRKTASNYQTLAKYCKIKASKLLIR